MSLATEYGQSRHRYLELIEEFPLRHIKNDRELDRAIRVIDSLLDKVRTNRAERDYLDALSTFVEAYEEKQHPIEAPSDAQMLEHLISARGVTQSEVAAETDIADQTFQPYSTRNGN
jgi:HTH-type transcriptional regulator/antitoxin HigA